MGNRTLPQKIVFQGTNKLSPPAMSEMPLAPRIVVESNVQT